MCKKSGNLILLTITLILIFALASCGLEDNITIVATIEVGALPSSTPIAPTPTIDWGIATKMEPYESLEYPFKIEVPADWEDATEESGVTIAWRDDIGTTGLGIWIDDLNEVGTGEISLDQYVELIIFYIESEDLELDSRERSTTRQGMPFEILEFSGGPGDLMAGIRMVYLHEGQIGFSATYSGLRKPVQDLRPWAKYTFSTFEVTE